MEKRLGKIQNVRFGLGGYQDVCIGIHFTLGGDGWGVMDDKSNWDAETVKCDEHCKWKEEDRDNQYAKIVRFISKLLKQAKVDSVDKLKNIPIEAEFEGIILKNWRILTEVI